MSPAPERLAMLLTSLLTFGLLALGLHMLALPDITLFRVWPYYLLPKAEILLTATILLSWFRYRMSAALIWLGMKAHRWLSALFMVAAMSADGLLHLFSIPHIEGWWLPLLGSGVAANATHDLIV